MRILLFTGKGGVGKSTLAAATACTAAASGLRTLALSTDSAHSLADALAHEAGSEPTEVAPCLWVQHVDPLRRLEQSWVEIQRYLVEVLDAAGVDRVTAEELTVLPGAEEVLALLEVRRQARSGEWDVLVVDCAPTAETLRLLALPEALGWYMDRLLPAQGRVVRALRPVLARAAGVPMPEDEIFDAVGHLHRELDEVRTLLTGPDASVRLVLTPERVVLAEARRAYTLLSLYGYRVDGVVVNRVFPSGGSDPWRGTWVESQHDVMGEVEDSFPGLEVHTCVYRDREPVGVGELSSLAADLYGGTDPLAPVGERVPLRMTRSGASTVLHLPLPLAAPGDVDLARKGDELVISVGSYRRVLTVPPSLARLRVTGARVRDGELHVKFTDEPPGEGL